MPKNIAINASLGTMINVALCHSLQEHATVESLAGLLVHPLLLHCSGGMLLGICVSFHNHRLCGCHFPSGLLLFQNQCVASLPLHHTSLLAALKLLLGANSTTRAAMEKDVGDQCGMCSTMKTLFCSVLHFTNYPSALW